MNIKYSLPLIVVSFLAVAAPALAQTAIPTFRLRQQINNERRDVKNELKDNNQLVRVTLAQSRADFNRQRIQVAQKGLLNAFSVRLTALQKYQAMIQTRLTAKKVNLPTSQNIIDAQARLDNITKNLLTQYNTDYTAFKNEFDQITASNNPKSLLPELKSLAKVVEQDLKNIRTELVAALRLVVRAK